MLKYRLIATTQCHEYYGDETGGRWKAKGGTDYVLFETDDANVAFNMTQLDISELVAKHSATLCRHNEYYMEDLISVEWVTGLTWFEQQQLEYDGAIQFSAHQLC